MNKKIEFPVNCRSIHFIGVGGISMSSLALIAQEIGHTVSGSDDDGSNIMLPHLRECGVRIYTPLSAENIDSAAPDAVVFTAAIHESNPELKRAREKGIPVFTRAEYLGYVMLNYKKRIGISGTHGKSTTTAMIYSLMSEAKYEPTVCCGAVIPSIGRAFALGKKDEFVYEACEYTDSFLHFYPTTAVILNIELDHTDYFPDIETLIASFGKSVSSAERVITLYDSENCIKAVKDFGGEKVFVSSDNDKADYYAANIVSQRGYYSFDVMHRGNKFGRITLSIPGRHNMTNALFAIAAAMENGVSFEKCVKGIEKFRGIDRRFELVGKYKGRDVYIDYAHHPGEISATVATAKETVRGRLVVVFQSHTHTRTAQFKDGFVNELSKCDEVIITPTYSAREAINDTGVTAKDIADAIPCGRYEPDFESAVEYIKKNGKDNDTYIFMGAGSINNAAYMLIDEDIKGKNNG